MKSECFCLVVAVSSCFIATNSKPTEPSSDMGAHNLRNINSTFEDQGLLSVYDSECKKLIDVRSMTFYAQTGLGADKLECIECWKTGIPDEVTCSNTNYRKAPNLNLKCSVPGFRITYSSVECKLQDGLCYKPGLCTLTIRIAKESNKAMGIGLIAVAVMAAFVLCLYMMKQCSQKVQESGRPTMLTLPVRREAPADTMRRSFQSASSPDVHRAVTIPVRAVAPVNTSPTAFDDPPPSYEQVVGMSK